MPGVVYLEIDGLAHDVLRRAFANGNAPTLASWVRDGTTTSNRWETDWSSQTGACQAGILHGNNHDMPAFRWWEKDLNKAIVTNHPRDAAEIERRQSDGNGLLADNGASRANILSGDAHQLDADHEHRARAPRQDRPRLRRLLRQALRGREDRGLHVHRDLQGAACRLEAGRRQRRAADRPLPDLRDHARLGDRDPARPPGRRGGRRHARRPARRSTRPSSPTTKSPTTPGSNGPTRWRPCGTVDRQIARIVKAAQAAPRPYRFVVLSDHGQSQGMTFLDRYGITLEDLVVRSAAATTSRRRPRAKTTRRPT